MCESLLAGQRQAVEAQKRQLVPIATLEGDPSIDHVKEATPPQSERVTPLEHRPFPFFEDVLDDEYHLCRSKAGRENLANSGTAFDRSLSNLVVHRVLGVETRECVYVGSIESLNPGVNELARVHAFVRQQRPRWQTGARNALLLREQGLYFLSCLRFICRQGAMQRSECHRGW